MDEAQVMARFREEFEGEAERLRRSLAESLMKRWEEEASPFPEDARERLRERLEDAARFQARALSEDDPHKRREWEEAHETSLMRARTILLGQAVVATERVSRLLDDVFSSAARALGESAGALAATGGRLAIEVLKSQLP